MDCRSGVPGVTDEPTHDAVRFAPAIESNHLHLESEDWERIYVVGDVHGCIDELERLFDQLDIGSDDAVVFVGDLVRKGPDSQQVVERVRTAPNCVSVRGNNEQKVLDGRADIELDQAQRDYLETLPLAITVADSLVVHGGIDPRKSFREQTEADLLECRSIAPTGGYDQPFWFERHAGSPRVFFGHTVLDDPFVTESAVGLDTGCVHGGGLTAYELGRERVHRVPSAEQYQQRSQETVVSTDELIRT